MTNSYIFLGKLIYKLYLPLLRLFLKGGNRVYGLIVYDDQVLVVKNWLSEQQWRLPGGGAKTGEQVEQTLVRELVEELNIQLDEHAFWKLVEGFWKTDKLNFKYHILLIHLQQKPQIRPSKLELIDATWLNPKELNLACTSHEILSALSLAGLI